MATVTFCGGASLRANVWTVTPGGTIAATDTFTISINGKELTFTATTTTVAHVVTGLYNLITDSTEPEWLAIEATDSTTHLTITVRDLGVPVTVVASTVDVSGGADPTLTASEITTATGPRFANLAANWRNTSGTAGLPANGDTVIIEGNPTITYGMDLSAIAPAAVYIYNFSGQIGLPPRNSAGYPEYLERYLLINSAIVEARETNESGLCNINTGSATTTLTVSGTGTPLFDTVPAFNWLGSETTNTANIIDGDVGIGVRVGETAKVTTMRVGDGIGKVPTVQLGAGLTLVTLKQAGGDVQSRAGCTTATVEGGTFKPQGSAAITTLNVRTGGTVMNESSGTIGTTHVGTRGRIVNDHRARTMTTVNMYGGSSLIDHNKNTTFTNGLVLVHCAKDDVELDVGAGVTITVA